jgi:sugar lactone lactonase YvrE
MTASHSYRFAFVAAALALPACSGAGGSAATVTPAGTSVAPLSYVSSNEHRLPGTRTVAATAHVRGWLSPQAKSGKNLIYVTSNDGSITSGVYIYPLKGQDQAPSGLITAGTSAPQGLSIDAQGDLFVANSGNNTVTEYAPGTMSPSTTYANGVSAPFDVKVGSDGTVYVANTAGGPSGAGTVTEYAAESTSPERTLTLSGYVATSLALDSSGNLYVGWFGFSAFNVIVEEYAPGATTGTNLNLDLPSNSFPAYGLVVDPKGDLDVWYESLDHTVKYLAAFPPGATEPAFTIQGGSFLTNVFGMTFSRKGQAYFATPNDNAVVDLKYPKGIPLDYIAVDAAEGIALSPGS